MGASTKTRRVFLYAFVVVAFVSLAWRNEVLDDKTTDLIEQKVADNYRACQARKANVERLNTLYEQLALIEARNPYRNTSPQTINDRIRLYRSAQLKPPTCVRGNQ